MSTPEDVRAQNLFPEWRITEHEKEMLRLFEEADMSDPLNVYTPEKAQRELEMLGYDASSWARIVEEKIGSHDIRSLAVVALGTQPRLLYEIYMNHRAVDYIEGWPPLGNEMGIAPVLERETWQTEALKRAIQNARSAED